MTANAERNSLQYASYISYSVQFYRYKDGEVKALIDSCSKLNSMTIAFSAKFDHLTLWTRIVAQKIARSALKIYSIITAKFLMLDKLCKIWYFEKSFLLANNSMDVVLVMLFLAFINAEILFSTEISTGRAYIWA